MQTFADVQKERRDALPKPIEAGDNLEMVNVVFGTYEYENKTINSATVTLKDKTQKRTSSEVLLKQLHDNEEIINNDGLSASVVEGGKGTRKYLTFA